MTACNCRSTVGCRVCMPQNFPNTVYPTATVNQSPELTRLLRLEGLLLEFEQRLKALEDDDGTHS
jgi:hypothetical protein